MMKRKGISNNLDKLINIEKAKRTLVSGDNVTIQDVINDVADFCKIGEGTIKSYKKGLAIPSLPIALRIAEYFRVNVENIFVINDYDSLIENLSNKGRKPRPYNKTCKYGECQNEVLAMGLCKKHYYQKRTGKINIEI